MVAIVLTGEIGAGKSTVLSWFAAQGDTILDADAMVSELWQRPDVLAQAMEIWGADVVTDGQLNRRCLAEKAFSSEASQKQLCNLLHPLVRLEMERQLPPHGLVIAEIPMVFESGRPWWTEGILFLRAPLETRSHRNMCRGLDETELVRREVFFLDSTMRAAASDWIIDNAGSVECLYHRLTDLRQELLLLDSLVELRWRTSSDQVSLLNSLVKKKMLADLAIVKDEREHTTLSCHCWTTSKLLTQLPEFQKLTVSKTFTMKIDQRRLLLSALRSC